MKGEKSSKSVSDSRGRVRQMIEVTKSISKKRTGTVLLALSILVLGAIVALLRTTQRTPGDDLTAAAAAADLGKVISLLAEGVPIDSLDEEGKTALGRAAQKGHRELVRVLLDQGADPNVRARYDKTPLMPAASQGHLEVVRLLLDRGGDENATDRYNQTALMCASLRGHKEIVMLLLERGADVNVKTRKGYTALSLASDRGHQDVCQLVLDKKPDLSVCRCQVGLSRYP